MLKCCDGSNPTKPPRNMNLTINQSNCLKGRGQESQMCIWQFHIVHMHWHKPGVISKSYFSCWLFTWSCITLANLSSSIGIIKLSILLKLHLHRSTVREQAAGSHTLIVWDVLALPIEFIMSVSTDSLKIPFYINIFWSESKVTAYSPARPAEWITMVIQQRKELFFFSLSQLIEKHHVENSATSWYEALL